MRRYRYMRREGERWELRLLSQPLYRYEKASDDVLGGAVFAFVGYITDPENSGTIRFNFRWTRRLDRLEWS